MPQIQTAEKTQTSKGTRAFLLNRLRKVHDVASWILKRIRPNWEEDGMIRNLSCKQYLFDILFFKSWVWNPSGQSNNHFFCSRSRPCVGNFLGWRGPIIKLEQLMWLENLSAEYKHQKSLRNHFFSNWQRLSQCLSYRANNSPVHKISPAKLHWWVFGSNPRICS